MKLYIIRHGETAWNVEGRLQGQTDTELNENGVRLAKVTAEGLKNIPFDLGISSPLRHAKHTAELVLGGQKCAAYDRRPPDGAFLWLLGRAWMPGKQF